MIHRDAHDMSSAPIVPDEIDRLRQLPELARKPVAISIDRAVEAGRDRRPEPGWRKTNDVLVAQMRNEIVPDRFGLRISVDENDSHDEFLPDRVCPTGAVLAILCLNSTA